MRLADFIMRDMEAILVQWEAFAATLLPAATGMSSPALRDHAQQILEAVVKDLSASQSDEAQAAKSMGRVPKLIDARETAAQTHGFLRAQSGFDISQITGEFRALRASVLRLWIAACGADSPHLGDLIRFNEAIDQALAESVAFFSEKAEEVRNLLLGMLGHDMRTPLQAIQMTATYIAALNAGTKVSEAAAHLINSSTRMKALLDELVEFNRDTLGVGIRIARTQVDLAALFADELDELRAAYPQRQLEMEVTGDTRGLWDGHRLQRLLGNLVVNALKYGTQDAPVRVVVAGNESSVHFEVRNSGTAVDQATLEQLFEPLKRGPHRENRYNSDAGLGLGLYVAREIAKAHGGEIKARCENTETVFAVRLPRS